jgi:anti-sigma regulatory factor (Ser/Thr protein kinase)
MASDHRPTDPVRTDDSSEHSMTVLARETRSASRARSWLRAFLDEAGLAEPVQADAALVMSELVTNALRHGLGEIVARAKIGDHGHVDLSVTDSGSEQPELQAVDPERVGGVGLHVVAQVSDEWGVARFPGGKTVWARIAVPGR